MDFIKRFNKEQMTCGGAILLAALLLFMGTAGSASVDPVKLPAEAERAYKGPPARAMEFVLDKLDPYLQGGRNPFEGAATSTLALPELKGPEPRPEDLVVPPFRPSPSFEALNRTQLAVKYRPLSLTAPSMAAADLPTQAEFDELKAIVEPELAAVVDRRNEKEFENDVLHLVASKPIEGKFIITDATGVLFKDLKTGVTGKYPLDKVGKDPEWPREPWIDYAWTNEERWKKKNERYGPRDLEKHLKLGRWAREKGMAPEARQSFRLAIEAAKARSDFKADFLAAVRELSELLMSRSDFDGALAFNLEMTTVSQFDKAEFLARAGDCLRAVGALDGAADYYRQSINESPRYVRGRVALGRALYELGQDDQARIVMGQLPNFLVPGTTPPADVVEGHLVTGLLALRIADFKAARAAFDAAAKLDATSPEAKGALACVSIFEGATKDAATQLVAAVKANQYFIDGWLNLGGMYLAAGQMEQADAMYAQARLRDPSSPEALIGAAVIAILKNAPAEAQPLLDLALKIDPTHYYGHYALGAVLAATDGTAALTHYQGALQDEFFFLPAYYGAAMTYLNEARRAEIETKREGITVDEIEKLRATAQKGFISAETLLQAIQRNDPSRFSTGVALGCVYASQGRAAEAIKSLQDAQSKLQVPDPLISYALGYVEFRYGSGEPKVRLENAKILFLRGKNVPPTPADAVATAWGKLCGLAVEKVQEWLETTVRLDDRFEGRDGETVGMNWLEFDREGVKIAIEKGRCKFGGTYIGKPYFLTSLERDTPRAHFQSFEVTLMPENTSRCEFGIAVLTNRPNVNANATWSGLWVGFDGQGKLRRALQDTLTANGGQLVLTGMEVKVTLPDPKMVRLKIERGLMGTAGQTKCLNVYLWIPARNEYELIDKEIPIVEGAGNEYRVMVWSRSDKNSEYLFSMDNARILERMRK